MALTSFPIATPIGKGENPTWLYGVAFRGTDVWGPG